MISVISQVKEEAVGLKIKRNPKGIWQVKLLNNHMVGAVTEKLCYEEAKIHLQESIKEYKFLMNKAKQQYQQLVEDNK